MRYSTLTILFSALLAATALALPSENNHIDVPEAHTDAIDRREVKPTSTSTSTSAAATNTPAAAEKNDDDEGPDFPDETGDRGSVDVPEDDGDDDDDDDDDSDDEDEKKKGGQ